MNLESARTFLQTCRERMDTLYQRPVFNEWAIVSFASVKPEIVFYDGPRADDFRTRFHSDSAPLFAEMDGRSYTIGDFEFVQDAQGSRFDACVKVGEKTYLLCNDTQSSMQEIRADPRWRKAQAPFVALTDEFRADPLN